MTISIITNTIPLRDEALAWDELGPGRYPGEVAVKLATNELVAVSVVPQWLENGAGVSLDGNARWIQPDGTTKLSPDGKHVEANLITTVTAADVAEFGLEPLAKDVALLIVGQDAKVMRTADAANDVPARPVIALAEAEKNSVSIKTAADMVTAANSFSLSLS